MCDYTSSDDSCISSSSDDSYVSSCSKEEYCNSNNKRDSKKIKRFCKYCKSPSLTERTAFVDNIFGNDVTGRVQDPSKPFLTILAAINAIISASGTRNSNNHWRVVVNPGNYPEVVNLPSFIDLVGSYQQPIISGLVISNSTGVNISNMIINSVDIPTVTSSSSQVTIINCQLNASFPNSTGSYDNFGISLSGSGNNISMNGCVVTMTGGNGDSGSDTLISISEGTFIATDSFFTLNSGSISVLLVDGTTFSGATFSVTMRSSQATINLGTTEGIALNIFELFQSNTGGVPNLLIDNCTFNITGVNATVSITALIAGLPGSSEIVTARIFDSEFLLDNTSINPAVTSIRMAEFSTLAMVTIERTNWNTPFKPTSSIFVVPTVTTPQNYNYVTQNGLGSQIISGGDSSGVIHLPEQSNGNYVFPDSFYNYELYILDPGTGTTPTILLDLPAILQGFTQSFGTKIKIYNDNVVPVQISTSPALFIKPITPITLNPGACASFQNDGTFWYLTASS